MNNNFFDTSNGGLSLTNALLISLAFLAFGCAIYLNTDTAYALFDTLAYEIRDIADYKVIS